ncbi:cytochrome c biogenesis heme-transporting ATPase CcmA [Ferrovum sp. PN-J185]|uniref:cytochrome c biogenesis heme-transporting ATPase CcmA n=1 Tax=Ferrovum sp. PN-J185 TaxID=1356306 RepID=UPI00226F953F|nr:cytochrome c biogenesis heme-transporting ATPase CcmA [Ferrovum sp. PN-J185]MCC6068048.1 cytochrome c biogenesis heme-transporting ATPase CcmA [Ferrovum sp. PN-J185]
MNLSVKDLSCQRGERLLFEHISFQLEPHQWCHVTGENGAGKTSLLRLCAGLSSPLSGSISWGGVNIPDDLDGFHKDLLYLGHASGLKEELTPLENLTLMSQIDGQPATEDTILSVLSFWGLAGREDLPVRVLSAGQRRRVLLSRLLLKSCPLWILDEPFNALDKKAINTLYDLLTNHVSKGGLLLVTSHQPMEMAEGIVLSL